MNDIIRMILATMFVIGAAICIDFVAGIIQKSTQTETEAPKHIIVRTSNGTVLGYLKSWNWKTSTFSVTPSEEEAQKFYDEFDPCKPYTLDGMILHLNSLYKNQLFLPYTFVRSEERRESK